VAEWKPPHRLAEIARVREMTGIRKRPRDPAQLAKFIVDVATGQVEDREPTPRGTGQGPRCRRPWQERRRRTG
jgi:hypothetical protein